MSYKKKKPENDFCRVKSPMRLIIHEIHNSGQSLSVINTWNIYVYVMYGHALNIGNSQLFLESWRPFKSFD